MISIIQWTRSAVQVAVLLCLVEAHLYQINMTHLPSLGCTCTPQHNMNQCTCWGSGDTGRQELHGLVGMACIIRILYGLKGLFMSDVLRKIACGMSHGRAQLRGLLHAPLRQDMGSPSTALLPYDLASLRMHRQGYAQALTCPLTLAPVEFLGV